MLAFVAIAASVASRASAIPTMFVVTHIYVEIHTLAVFAYECEAHTVVMLIARCFQTCSMFVGAFQIDCMIVGAFTRALCIYTYIHIFICIYLCTYIEKLASDLVQIKLHSMRGSQCSVSDEHVIVLCSKRIHIR